MAVSHTKTCLVFQLNKEDRSEASINLWLKYNGRAMGGYD